MVRCAVFGCKSDPESKSFAKDPVMFFRFPKDKDLRDAWKHKCYRADVFHTENARICSKHFAEKDYMRNLKYELLGHAAPKSSRKLKLDAVPTLNLPRSSARNAEDSQSRTLRKDKRAKKKVVEELLAASTSCQLEFKSFHPQLVQEQEILLPLLPNSTDTDPLEVETEILPFENVKMETSEEVKYEPFSGFEAFEHDSVMNAVAVNNEEYITSDVMTEPVSDEELIGDIKIEPVSYEELVGDIKIEPVSYEELVGDIKAELVSVSELVSDIKVESESVGGLRGDIKTESESDEGPVSDIKIESSEELLGKTK